MTVEFRRVSLEEGKFLLGGEAVKAEIVGLAAICAASPVTAKERGVRPHCDRREEILRNRPEESNAYYVGEHEQIGPQADRKAVYPVLYLKI